MPSGNYFEMALYLKYPPQLQQKKVGALITKLTTSSKFVA